jgi:hypothetical protein
MYIRPYILINQLCREPTIEISYMYLVFPCVNVLHWYNLEVSIVYSLRGKYLKEFGKQNAKSIDIL